MPVEGITAKAVAQISRDLGLGIEDYDGYARLINAWLPAYQALDGMPDNLPLVKYPRASIHRPEPADNVHNAWSYKVRITGGATES